MTTIKGIHLLPAGGEFTYDTLPAIGWQANEYGLEQPTEMNTFYTNTSSTKTDYSYSIDQLQALHPECTTVSLVIAWFFDSETAGACRIYPSTNFIGGVFEQNAGGGYAAVNWMVSSLTQGSSGLIPLPLLAGASSFVYGGTPSDPSVVRCIRDLRLRGFKVIFYPFLLSTASGYPWRGRITYSPDLTSAATTAVNGFLGSAATSEFTRDTLNLTVAYSGNPLDWTYRRMILHYANLCVLAGGVNAFIIGSEMRGLETIRGPGWTKAGTLDGSGNVIWDYPFVAGMTALSDDVRSVFDGAGLTKSLSTLSNLVAYSADWSNWMGFQHPGENGQWPHLDSLWAHSNIDFVSLDNYQPLSDWTTGGGGLDVSNWSKPAPSGSWPPSTSTMNGLGLAGVPSIYSPAYLKANIEGGERFNWFYNDGNNDGRGLDPNGSGLMISLPGGDRLAQDRQPYYANQQILANKQYRWWWNNLHYAVYDDSDGTGWSPHGARTEWVPQSKSIALLEYGFAAMDKATNQPNVFFDAKSVESATPYWSIWDSGPSLTYLPRRDDTISAVALQAIYDYWSANNETSGAGVVMIQFAFSCVWNWDARPFPTFPILGSQWGDAGNWQAGDWSNGLRQPLPPAAPSPPPTPPAFQTFPALMTLAWSVGIKPKFSTDIAAHVSGRASRRGAYARAYRDLDLTYEVLRADAAHLELQAIAGFFAEMRGEATPFWFAPPGLSVAAAQGIGTGDGVTTVFPLVQSMGGYDETVDGTSGVTAVYLNGTPQVGGWTVSSGWAPAISFATAPGAGVAITADFGVLWLCRFADDVQDFEEFMSMLFSLRTLKLTTARP